MGPFGVWLAKNAVGQAAWKFLGGGPKLWQFK